MRKLLTSMAMASLWLAVTLFGAPSDGQLVLCHGADGHVALEPAHDTSCGSAPGSAKLADAGVITSVDCTDVPANHHPAHQTAKRPTERFGSKRQSAPLWSDAFRTDVSGGGHSVPDGGALVEAAQRPLHLALLQTVVLRL